VLGGRSAAGRGGVEAEHPEVLRAGAVVRERDLLDAEDRTGGDDHFVAVVARLLVPVEAHVGARRAERHHGSLRTQKQGARGLDVGTGARVGEADHVAVRVQDHAAVHAQAALEQRVVAALGAGGRLLDVEPLAGAGVGAQVVFLERVHDAHERLVAVDLARLQDRDVGSAAALAVGLGLGAVDHPQAELVGGVDVVERRGVATEQAVVAVRRHQAIVGAAGVVRRQQEVGVDPAGAGQVDEQQFVHQARPPAGLLALGLLAQIVQRALARHLAARVHTAPRLVDVDLVGVELLRFFLAFEDVLALDGRHLQLGQQVVADLLAGVRLQIGQDLDGHFGVRAPGHEALVEVGLLAGVQGQEATPALDGLGIVDPDDGASHRKRSPSGVEPQRALLRSLTIGSLQTAMLVTTSDHAWHDMRRIAHGLLAFDLHVARRGDPQPRQLAGLLHELHRDAGHDQTLTGANVDHQAGCVHGVAHAARAPGQRPRAYFSRWAGVMRASAISRSSPSRASTSANSPATSPGPSEPGTWASERGASAGSTRRRAVASVTGSVRRDCGALTPWSARTRRSASCKNHSGGLSANSARCASVLTNRSRSPILAASPR